MMHWVSVNPTRPLFFFGERVFTFLLGSQQRSTLKPWEGETFSGRVTVQLIPCCKFWVSGCKQIKITCQSKLLLGLEVCLVAFFVVFFFLHAAVSLSCLFLLSLQALKLTRDVEREPFAKSAVSKWTVILFTAYDLCEPCIIFLTKQTVNRPLTGVKILFFFFSSFFFSFLGGNWTNSEVCKIFLFWDGQAPAVETMFSTILLRTHCVAFAVVTCQWVCGVSIY